MNVLLLSRYAISGASSRVRFFQFFPQLSAAGIHVTAQPLLDDQYLRDLYAGRRRDWWRLGKAYARRLRSVLTAADYDVVWVEKECWPWMPALVDPTLLAARAPFVVDYDDAVFHNYDQSASRLVRVAFGNKIDAVMSTAALVTAGNEYLAQRARVAGASRIEILPSVVDVSRYVPRSRSEKSGLAIGWIGSPATQYLLEPIVPVLRELIDPATDRFVTIGANFPEPLFDGHKALPWAEASETHDLAQLDVGIMPLADRPFERGKCGFKIVQYMAAGVAVVASPVGVNETLVRHGVTGFLARTREEWAASLRRLRDSPALRMAMGQAGRSDAETSYSAQVVGPRIIQLLSEVANARR